MVRENKMWVKLLSFKYLTGKVFKYLTGKVDSTTLGALGENFKWDIFFIFKYWKGRKSEVTDLLEWT